MIHPRMKNLYVGVDLHRRTHTAVLINCFKEKLFEITFLNKPSEFETTLKEIKKHVPRGKSLVWGLEDISNYGKSLTSYLINKKQTVKYVNPNLTYSDRNSQAILHKTDLEDAFSVAKVTVDNFDSLPDATIKDNYWILSQLVSRRRSLVKSSVTLKNQIHNHISQHYPSYKKFWSVFDSTSALEFWQTYPSPQKLQNVGAEELGSFLWKHSRGYYSFDKAAQILKCVADDGNTTTEYQSTRDFIVSTSVIQLKQNMQSIKEIEEELKDILPSFGYKLETMKGINTVMAAEFIAEINDINRFATADKLAKYAGLSPVVYASGQTDKHFSNRRGDRKLHELFFKLAVTVSNECGHAKKPVNPIFREYYKKKISQGKTTKQALKAVMRRLCNIIFWMMKNKSEYIQPK
ncbi:MAG TPA: IS110 family transposase [Pseudobacteroides sp.]|uniref:IS110 family transposase n=1 Tax=Pseudobacteroides sp. TaxID=1968840 RepID=UPI002F93559A